MLQVGVSILAAAWAVRLIIRPYRVELSTVLIPLAGMVLWGLLQLITHQTVYPWETWHALLFWATILVALLLALQVFADGLQRARFVSAVLAFGLIVAVVSTLQLFSSEGKVFWLFQTQAATWRDATAAAGSGQNRSKAPPAPRFPGSADHGH